MGLTMKDEKICAIAQWRHTLEHGEISFSNWEQAEFPAEAVIRQFFITGKHFGDPELLEELTRIQHALSTLQPEEETNAFRLTKALMRSFLDKHTQTYDHLTYTALPVFELFQDNRNFDILLRSQAEIIIALICDLIQYELNTLLGQEHRLQEHLPEVRKLKQRIYVAIRAIGSCSPYVDHLILPTHMEHIIELWQQETQHEEIVSTYLADETFTLTNGLLQQMDPQLHDLLKLSLIPVYVAHDEYLFLRILQAFEMIFYVIAEGLKHCVSFIAAEHYSLAAERFHVLNNVLRLSPALFRILSTMTSTTFNSFREYMRGASALQSEYYKKIELYASHPDPQRFRSPSFDSVPRVTREYQQISFTNLQDVVAPLLLNGSHRQQEAIQTMIAGMTALDATFVTWKVTHYRLVKALIGDAPGTSGQTTGTPYLKLMLEMPLFPYLKSSLPESAAI
jgi:tryptophan 2,3-dioxygenase